MLHDLLRELGISPRSQLAALEPLGAGTETVESLMSYLHRLANVHGVRPASLVTHFCSEHNRQQLLGWWSRDQLALADKFSELTCRDDLSALTLSRWKTLITNCGLYRRFRAWCPQCLSEMVKPYQPILWNLSAVTCCTRHKRELITACPECSKKLTVYAEGCISQACCRCKADLCSITASVVPCKWESWKAAACGDLLAYSHLQPVNDLETILEQFFRAHANKTAAARAAGLGYAFMHSRHRTTSLDTILRVAYSSGVKPSDLLFGNVGSLRVRAHEIPEKRIPIRPRYTQNELVQRITALTRKNPKLGAEETARLLGVSPRLLLRKCPVQYQSMRSLNHVRNKNVGGISRARSKGGIR
jgi:hypothetical protein